MQRTRYKLLRLIAPLLIFILGCPPPNPPPRPPEDFVLEGIETVARAGLTLLGEVFFLAPESVGAFLVQVRNPDSGDPIGNAVVDVILEDSEGGNETVFSGETDENGLLQVRFEVPADVDNPDQVLTIRADTPQGEVQYQEEVYVGRVYNILVSTDKPVYQPGQVIHIRGLALDSTALKPAQQEELVITVSDPGGNKLMRQTLTTSDYGVAAADFVLDTQATSGDYIITAEMGPVSSERSVEIKPYTLPRFELTFQSDEPFYLPGDTATGTVDAQYFFGKPVAGGEVLIEGYATDVDRFKVFEIAGVTDENGFFAYEFDVPDYFVGQLENNTADVDLEISVIDTANHKESIDESVTVAEKLILIDAVAESGFLQPDLENIIYLDVTYPDGRAATASLSVASDTLSETVTIETDEFGLATLSVTPTGNRDVILNIEATDDEGRAASQELSLGTSGQTSAVLMRPDRAEYQIGDTMNIDILVGGHAVTVYLDVIKDRQTFGLAALPVVDGVAQAALDIDGSLLGTLELNAYVIDENGEIVRDRRFALVNPAPATVDVKTDSDVYRPGDTALVDITVSQDGQPMPGAVGISIVDESVFSVGAQDPGFARTYFLLERELLEPRYEIHDFSNLADDDYSPYDDNPDSVRSASTGSGLPFVRRVNDAQQVALFGFFGEELAAIEQAEYDTLAAQQQVTPITDEQLAAAERDGMMRGWGYRMALILPLLGFAAYDGTRRRRKMFIALGLIGLSALIWSACASAPAPVPAAMDMAAESAPAEAQVADTTTATRGQAEPPRLRQFFPETLYWLPEVETDADGHVQIDVPIADSITTWRVSVLASDLDGNLGSAEVGMRVFQEFFVEPDMPRFLTEGDEIAVPISIFNYLDEAQEISLEVAESGWFSFLEEPTVTLQLNPNEVTVAYIPILVQNFGTHDFQITATGELMSDAVLREVEVVPNGQMQVAAESGKLAETQAFAVDIPETAIPGTASVTVKLYPGIVSQVLDGLDGMLQQPYGCFEQTSSTTYPNVLVLDYLKTTDQINPRIQLQAEQFINLGYQRLLTFEVGGSSGGFSLFGDPPPQTMLTAYGLMEFTDMSDVSYVDPALPERIATYLFDRQNADGSWEPQGMTIESGVERMGEGNLPATAYITWALADAGYANSAPVSSAISFMRENLVTDEDSYTLALVANALIASGNDATDILDQLADNALPAANDTLYWTTELSTWLDSQGDVASLETTAMVATAFLRSDTHRDVAQAAIDFIIAQRDSFGSFHTTQATILSLKALLLASEQGGAGEAATVTMTLNGDRTQTFEVDATSGDVVQQVTFDDLSLSNNELTIAVDGDRALQYQVITRYYVPWDAVPSVAEEAEAMRVDVSYDRAELQVNDTVNVVAEVELLAPGVAGTVLVDLGIPPGFSPITADLDTLVESGEIARYELTGRQILVYMTDVPSGEVYRLPYRLTARFPIRGQTPSSTAYDYYTPDTADVDTPQRIVVTLGTPGQ